MARKKIQKEINKNQDEMYEAIAKLSHQYYLERGGKHGNDLDDWIRAEQVIKSEMKKSSK